MLAPAGERCGLGRVSFYRSRILSQQSLAVHGDLICYYFAGMEIVCFSVVLVPSGSFVCAGAALTLCCPAVLWFQVWNCPVNAWSR